MSDQPTRPIRAHGERRVGTGEPVEPVGPDEPDLPEIAGLEKGTRFDRFVVIDRLGAGGMGVVVSAFDPDLDRKVAIKVLRAGSFSTSASEARARMVREAKAMARLTHPNVVTVHEVGTVADDVFLVMELVEGQTLGAWIEERRPWREVLEVMVAAGRGLAAAHAAGLVHRDFKPHNVLLGRDGRVRVTDFGVVGVAGAPTGDDVVIGTPAYMAPEQHVVPDQPVQPIDARADQFGFCVSLYEALYGQRPYDGETAEELRGAAMAGVVRPPPDGHDVPSRLLGVVTRGMARDPAARFSSMDALLAELERDPARTRRRVARVVGVACLAGVAVFGWARAAPEPVLGAASVCGPGERHLDEVWNPDVAAAMRAAFLAARPSQGAEAFTRTAARLDDYVTRWTAAHAAACGARRPDTETAFLARVSCLTQLRDQVHELTEVLQRGRGGSVVDGAISAVASLAPPESCAAAAVDEVPADDPAVVAIRARLGRAEALRRAGLFREAKEVAESLATDAAALPYPRLEAEAFLALGKARSWLDDGTGAEAALRHAARAAAEAGADAVLARAYTELLWVVGHVQGRAAEAQAMQPFAEAAVVRAGEPPALRAALWFHSAVPLVELGRYDAAVPYLERARDVWQHELDPRHPDAARPLITLGNVAGYRGRGDEASAYYRQALALRVDALGENHPDLVAPLGNLGTQAIARGDFDEALTRCRRALAITEAAFGADSSNRSRELRCLALAHRGKGELATARGLLEEAVAIDEPTVQSDQYYYVLTALAAVVADEGDHARALTLCDRALRYFANQVPADHPDHAYALTCRGRALVDTGDPAAARAPLERALALLAAGATATQLADARFALARAVWPVDRVRARGLATSARDGYADARDTRALAQVDTWLSRNR